jgi:hypothetical protein
MTSYHLSIHRKVHAPGLLVNVEVAGKHWAPDMARVLVTSEMHGLCRDCNEECHSYCYCNVIHVLHVDL